MAREVQYFIYHLACNLPPCISTVYVVTAIDPPEYNVQFFAHYIDNFLTTGPPDFLTSPVHQCSG